MRVVAGAAVAAAMFVPLAAGAEPVRLVTLHGEANRPTSIALVGGTPVWSVTGADGSIELRALVGSSVRRLYRAPLPPPPRSDDSFYVTATSQEIEAIGGTPTHVSFLRRVFLTRAPKCLKTWPPCRAGVFRELLTGQVLAGSLGGRFSIVAAADRRKDPCAAVPAVVAASGVALAYATEAVPRRACVAANATARLVHVTLAPRRRARVLERLRVGRTPTALALAGRHLADARDDCSCVVVRDLRGGPARRIALRRDSSLVTDLQLQPDGTLVFVGTVTRRIGTTLCGRNEVGYVAPRARGPRFLGWPAYQIGGFARNRVVYVSGERTDCAGGHTQLIAQRLGHSARPLKWSAQSLVDLDYDGARILTATAAGTDTVIRIAPLG